MGGRAALIRWDGTPTSANFPRSEAYTSSVTRFFSLNIYKTKQFLQARQNKQTSLILDPDGKPSSYIQAHYTSTTLTATPKCLPTNTAASAVA